jgi:hypothetical protein
MNGNMIVTGLDADILELLQAEGAGSGIEIVGNVSPAGDDPGLTQAILGRSAAVVRTQKDYKLREYPLGFDSQVAIAAGATVLVNSPPQIPFRVERLVIPSDIAGSFVVEEFTVGKNPQFASNIPVPGRVFDERAVGVRLRGDTAQVAQNVSCRITNISGAPVRFRAAVIGAALD